MTASIQNSDVEKDFLFHLAYMVNRHYVITHFSAKIDTPGPKLAMIFHQLIHYCMAKSAIFKFGLDSQNLQKYPFEELCLLPYFENQRGKL